MKKLKIAFVLNVFPTISETFILNQIAFLINQGHEVRIYSRAVGNQTQIHSEVSSYQLIENTVYVPTVPRSYTKRIKSIFKSWMQNRSLKYSLELIRCCNVFKIGRPALTLYAAYNYSYIHDISRYDIIHAHFGSSGLWMALYKQVGLLKNSALVVSFHGVDIIDSESLINRRRYRYLFKHADVCTVNSVYSKSLVDNIPISKGKIFLLPVGLNTKKFRPRKFRNSGQVEVLFCGRLISLKAPDLAIQIFYELVKQGVNNIGLTIIGDGPEREKLCSMIRRYNLNEKVKLVGAKTQDDLVKYYENADIFLFPGIHDPKTKRCETQGLVVQEAQAMGIPVVVSDVGGLKSGMKDGVTGFVVEEGNVKGFVETLNMLVNSPELRYGMGKAGREFVVSHFDADNLGFELEALYYKSINKLI